MDNSVCPVCWGRLIKNECPRCSREQKIISKEFTRTETSFDRIMRIIEEHERRIAELERRGPQFNVTTDTKTIV